MKPLQRSAQNEKAGLKTKTGLFVEQTFLTVPPSYSN
jgi:hypothetical protein